MLLTPLVTLVCIYYYARTRAACCRGLAYQLLSAHQHPLDHALLTITGYGGLDHDPHHPVDAAGHCYHPAHAHTLHSTPVEVYVLLECVRSTASLTL